MKRLKFKTILILLFSFCFLAMHDYMVQEKNYDAKQELHSLKYTSINIDLASQIHDNIHTILSIPFINELKTELITKKKELFFVKNGLVSINKVILQRPPIN